MHCYVNMGRSTHLARCIQFGLDTLLNLPFKSIFGLRNINRARVMLALHGASELYISRLTQDLEFVFHLQIRNTMIKNGKD
jgi:hypothetical protein